MIRVTRGAAGVVFRRHFRVLHGRLSGRGGDLKTFCHNLDLMEKKQSMSFEIKGVEPGQSRGRELFANRETSLAHINAYGFDYDYTIASYTQAVQEIIYRDAMIYLVNRMGYPKELAQKEYDASFPIRGLHFDRQTGLLLKLDQFGKLNQETSWYGREKVDKDKLLELYHGLHVPSWYKDKNLRLMADLFCLPEICLLADVTQTFNDHGFTFSPQYIQADVREAVNYLHASGKLHGNIMANPEIYLNPNPKLGEYLETLRLNGKKTFLLTNSPYQFVNVGMNFMLRDYLEARGVKKWTNLFDVTICSAKKPDFYARNAKFRKLNVSDGTKSFTPVASFKVGEVYTEGGLREFTRLFGIRGAEVIYMGDHIFADLVDPAKHQNWTTAAIITELGDECKVLASDAYQRDVRKVMDIDRLLEYGQTVGDGSEEEKEDVRVGMRRLKDARKVLHTRLKDHFNPYFGSPFRTRLCQSYFFFTLSRYSDIYTSSVDNFLNYSLSHTIMAKRATFPHNTSPRVEFLPPNDSPP